MAQAHKKRKFEEVYSDLDGTLRESQYFSKQQREGRNPLSTLTLYYQNQALIQNNSNKYLHKNNDLRPFAEREFNLLESKAKIQTALGREIFSDRSLNLFNKRTQCQDELKV